MNNNLKITKSDKKLEDFKKHLESCIVDECDALFITEEYDKNNVQIIFKNDFYKFIKENNSEINIVEYRESIDYTEVHNSIFYQIGEFIIRELMVTLIISLLANYISSKMENDDTINFTINIERKNDENMRIEYNGKVSDFKTILNETDNFNELLKENR